MGKLVQIGNIIIRVYANDHLPPHFHIVTRTPMPLSTSKLWKSCSASYPAGLKPKLWHGREAMGT